MVHFKNKERSLSLPVFQEGIQDIFDHIPHDYCLGHSVSMVADRMLKSLYLSASVRLSDTVCHIFQFKADIAQQHLLSSVEMNTYLFDFHSYTQLSYYCSSVTDELFSTRKPCHITFERLANHITCRHSNYKQCSLFLSHQPTYLN